jgi:DNA-binding response OmpR family regulator
MIIIMTAYASIDSAIEAVRQGAFDYLQKPCSADDIVSCASRALAKKEADDRQRELARQSVVALTAAANASTHSANLIHCGELEVDLGSHAVSMAGQPVSLTPTEYGLLEILAETPGQPISLQQLIEDGLGYDPHDAQAQETLRVHISRLRRKLDAKYILTVRGGGYALANIPPIN